MVRISTRRTNFVIRYPMVSFIFLALAFGGGTVYLVVQGLLPAGLALAAALSASLAGVLTTAFTDGRTGLRWMLSCLLIWRVGIGYWLFALLFPLLAIFLGSYINPLFNGDPISYSNMRPGFEILPMFLAFYIVAGLGQELGWTGYFTPRLQARYGALTSCFIRAILASIWHLPLLFYARYQLPALSDFPYSDWIAQKGYLVAVGVMVLLFQIPWSIFFGWMFNNTGGSLLLVSVLHGSEFWVAYWMLNAGINPKNLDNFWGYGTILVLTAVIITVVSGPQNLSRKHKRISTPPLPKRVTTAT